MGFDIDVECYLCNGNEFGLFSACVCYQCVQRVRKSEKYPIYRNAYPRICVYGCTFCGETIGCINATFCKKHIEKLLHLPPQKPWKYSFKDFVRSDTAKISYHAYVSDLFAGDFECTVGVDAEIDPVERDYLIPLKKALGNYLKSIKDDQVGKICPIMKKYGIRDCNQEPILYQ